MKTVASDSAISWDPVSVDDARVARERTREITVRTPVVRFDYDTDAEIYLKLELLQPIRSFKLRGSSNAILAAGRAGLADGVWTSSAGNMAQGVAYAARAIEVPAVVYMPDTAPQAKIDNVKRYGGEVRLLPVMEWAEVFRNRSNPGGSGVYIHPYSDPLVMAGNAVIGLELLEDLPDLDAVVVPWGGGGLCIGIASVIKTLRPECKVYACEVDTGAPLAAAFEAGKLVDVPFTPSFVDGISSPFVNQEMWTLAQELVDGSLVVTRAQIAAALRSIVERNRVVPEGAGATAVATALAGMAGDGKIACIVSGGNIDVQTLVTILEGGVPS
ncbi:MAG: pyridoxal-phosphate dependent enzyme [Thermomicrobiales bacterium]|nr:pyridoxal-phosphate dependent enzyme [Thermomicrobiales bacterium]